MKELLAVIAVLLSGVVGEAPAPYPPSGFRPNGPAFDLPQNNKPEYLPPLDPRRPLDPNVEPEIDVSVQGLPAREQVPAFQASPISGQQYSGPSFNTDLRNLQNSDSFKQNQYLLQQQKYREFERQRQLEAAQARSRANQIPNPQVPRQFASQPTPTPSTTETTFSTRNSDDFSTTTEPLDLNEGETLDDNKSESEKKVTVEVSKQNLQEYPGELFLSSLAQLQLQPQFIPLQQFGQIRAPILYQPSQQEQSEKQVAGYDAQTHFAALPSILAQRQQLNQQVFPQSPALLVAQEPINGYVQTPQPQYQPAINNQYQPVQPQIQAFPQPGLQPQQPQTQVYPQPSFPAQAAQPNQYSPRQPEANDANNQQEVQDQPQFVYQQGYQPQEVIYQPVQPQLAQPQPAQPQIPQYQTPEQNYFLPQAQLVSYPNQVAQYQNGFVPQQFLDQQVYQNRQQQIIQGQDAFLQSGLDANQQGNGLDQEQAEDNDENDDAEDQDDGSATAVATAFGARTQPRTFTRYGVPVPVPRASALPQSTPQSDLQTEQETEDTGAVSVANAFASGRRKTAKLRSRRVRPVFTVDRSGHLVLAQDQN